MTVRDVDDWFVGQVLPLEAALERFLRRRRLAGDEVSDLRQEVYARVYDAARRALPLSVKAFVFATAHNLLRDRARRARIVSIEAVADLDTLNLAADEYSTSRDFAVVTNDPKDVAAIETTFAADLANASITPPTGDDLV